MGKIKSAGSVNSPIGTTPLDSGGAAVGVVRMNPDLAYGRVPGLLQEYIESGSGKTWEDIRSCLDNLYRAVGSAMEALEAVEPFSKDILRSVEEGQKLLFKPNLTGLPSIDPRTHGPSLIGTCTPWEVVAAAMRWFHDRFGISYHQMALGEASNKAPMAAVSIARAFGDGPVTTQAVMEGKIGRYYGGWGFYFARQYLAECHDKQHKDNPLNGYEESLSGFCLPPGRVSDKLLVYDLNKIEADYTNGREITVPDGVNFRTITVHKAVVGGDPQDKADRRDWPGCVLVNIAKLKVHVAELFTGAVKNLGIGLYPLEAPAASKPGQVAWKYAMPNVPVPIVKFRIPHSRWIVSYDEDTAAPLRGEDGRYRITRTGGLPATMADIIQAVKGQGVRMVHILDAIEATNLNHFTVGCTPVQQGLLFAGNDMVAVDSCAARYLFNMVPMAESEGIRQKYHLNSDVIQKVPFPAIEGKDILTQTGYDSPFSRYDTLHYCARRGLGREEFYVVGTDLWQGGELASLKQHLGRVEGGEFSEILTPTLYYNPSKLLWDLQASCLTYLENNDRLTGSDYKRRILEAYDENRDGVIDYEETGRLDTSLFKAYSGDWTNVFLDPLQELKFRFLVATAMLKLMKPEWNPDQQVLQEGVIMVQSLVRALAMAGSGQEAPDPSFPHRTWGKGKWPSFQYVLSRQELALLYGPLFPDKFDPAMSPYGCAFSYADARWNKGLYRALRDQAGSVDIIKRYHQAAAGGEEKLPFTLYVPPGLGTIDGQPIPNTLETSDPQRMFTARFDDGETWQYLHLSEFGF